ncbi:retrovirus-related pol polyprotein from transposon TNT 1-94 [Tanacetum coccineum]|uniref:Retrovirus-related pol polyprotein from transposon TNT 1-94 n=1 Tax=Tanacetum coccineum TaxID=301880 RepID=A0ABQ5FB79_9ASTR
MHEDYEYVKSLEKEVDELESEKADFSNIYDLLLEECVSKDVTCSYCISLSDLKLNVELQCLYLNDVNARTKKPNVVPISASKPKRKMNKSVATPHKKTVASDTTIQKSKSYYKELYENTNQEWKWWIAKTCPSGYTWTQKPLRTKKIWMPKIRKDDVSTSISPTIDIVSRITNEIYFFCERSNRNVLLTGNRDPISTQYLFKKTTDHQLQSVFMAKASLNSSMIHLDSFLRSRTRNETPKVLKDFSTIRQRNLQAQVITVRTDRGTEFLNKTLHAYFKEEGIEHQTSTPRTPEQNGVVERRNRTLVEAARTMLSASKLPLSFWAEAVATACYTQNRSIIISTHGKTAYHIINDRKPSIKHLHIFGCICYITRDGENLDKMKEKGDPCVMVGYSTQSKGYRVYNKRTRLIVESIHIKFDEIKEMMSDHNSSDLAPQRQEMSVENVSSGLVPQGQKASDYDNSDPVPPRQNVVPTAEKTDSSHQGLEFLFSPLIEEYYTPTHGQAEENNNDQAPNASFQEAEFINPFCTRVQEIEGPSSIPTDKKVCELVDKHLPNMIIKLKWLRKNKKEKIKLHKVVRLGINPMIQPEPEDLPKDNPKLEIAVLSKEVRRCKSVIAWNSIISGFAHLDKSNYVTLATTLPLCAQMANLQHDMYASLGKSCWLKGKGSIAILSACSHSAFVIRTMPYDPTPAMWATVIGGCRILGKNKLRKFAVEKLLEMRPRSSEYYVLVANMYADYNGCWKKLANIRVLIRNWE